MVPVTDLLPKQMDQAAFAAQVKDLLAGYRRTLETDRRFLLEQYELTDMARKVVGVGSVGTRCWIVLMLGPALPAGRFHLGGNGPALGPGGLRPAIVAGSGDGAALDKEGAAVPCRGSSRRGDARLERAARLLNLASHSFEAAHVLNRRR